jgi:hypothetical protein
MKLSRIVLFLAANLFALASLAFAQQIPNIQGRWEFVITTGDSQNQLNNMGQSSISTYLLQTGSVVTNNVPMTTDNILADTYVYDNGTFTGTINKQDNVVLTYTVVNQPGDGQPTFNYVFTGTFKERDSDNPKRITGTYTSTADSSTGSGDFIATFFPDFKNVTYSGGFVAPLGEGAGPYDVPAIITLNTNADHSVSVTNLSIGGSLAACFVPPFTTVNDPNFPLVPTDAAGVGVNLYVRDSVGTQLSILGYFVEPDGFSPAALQENYGNPLPTNTSYAGTNTELLLWYGITSNNSCNGYGGGDNPFHRVPESHKSTQKPGHGKH